MEEIAAEADRVWRTDGDAPGEQPPEVVERLKAQQAQAARPAPRSGASRRSPTRRRSPARAGRRCPTASSPSSPPWCPEAPTGDDWIHEIKFDGYRVMTPARGRQGDPVHAPRRELDRPLPDADRRRRGGAGQARAARRRGRLREARRAHELPQAGQRAAERHRPRRAHRLLRLRSAPPRRLRPDQEPAARAQGGAAGASLRASARPAACATSTTSKGAGTSSSRRRASSPSRARSPSAATRPYRPGRGRDWLKVKCLQRQEFVIGGFTERANSRPAASARSCSASTRRRPGRCATPGA